MRNKYSMFIISILYLCGTVYGNAIVISHQISIVSESGNILISPNHAEVMIRFKFSTAKDAEYHSDKSGVYLQIPIWVPSDPNLAPMKEFWHHFPIHRLHHLNETNADVMKKTLAFQLKVSGKNIPIDNFATFTYHADKFRMPMSWREKGFNCILFNFGIPPENIVRGQNVDIKYNVPLAIHNGKKQFLYIPFFYYLPKNYTLEHKDDYSLTFLGSQNAVLSPQGDYVFKGKVKPNGFSILPEHEKKIIVNITSEKN